MIDDRFIYTVTFITVMALACMHSERTFNNNIITKYSVGNVTFNLWLDI